MTHSAQYSAPRPEEGLFHADEPGLGGWYTDAEFAALAEVFGDMGTWASTYARHFQESFEAEFAAYVHAPHAVSVNSGGAALDLAMACLDAEPGDDVISCAVNFPGTHLAVLGAGLRLILAEPDPVTLNLDPGDIERRTTRHTRAVLITHMNGLPADMPAITSAVEDAAARLGIEPPRLIVDGARSVGAATPGGPVGCEGWITIFSFHRKKPMTTLGEGGMLVTSCAETDAKLRRLRSFGNRETWGSSHRMTEFQAAVGSVQLRRLKAMNDARIHLARQRTHVLTSIEEINPPPEPAGYTHVYSLYNVLLSPGLAPEVRDRALERLRDHHGVGAVIANPPTYAFHRLIHAHTLDQQPLPVAEDVAGRLFCPALHPLMSAEDNIHATEAVADSVRHALHPR